MPARISRAEGTGLPQIQCICGRPALLYNIICFLTLRYAAFYAVFRRRGIVDDFAAAHLVEISAQKGDIAAECGYGNFIPSAAFGEADPRAAAKLVVHLQ